jgi:hypothetical protein
LRRRRRHCASTSELRSVASQQILGVSLVTSAVAVSGGEARGGLDYGAADSVALFGRGCRSGRIKGFPATA